MYLNVNEINSRLEKTSKAIISLGCSFPAGQGALDDEIYEEYNLVYPGPGYPFQLPLDKKFELVKRFPLANLILGTHELSFKKMEFKNSFVSVLADKYFDKEYVPINFSEPGGANRGRIKELYLNPDINWHKIKDIIVIFMPTGIERFDFVNDANFHINHYKTIWPTCPNNEKSKKTRATLWEYYGKAVYTEKSGVIEQIGIVQELLTWCKLKNAKLIITPGFDRRYNKSRFQAILKTEIKRDENWDLTDIIENKDEETVKLADLWPWENMFYPEGHATLIDLCMDQEPSVTDKNDHYFQFQNNRSPLGWITPCSHPGKKGHDLYAKLVYNHLLTL